MCLFWKENTLTISCSIISIVNIKSSLWVSYWILQKFSHFSDFKLFSLTKDTSPFFSTQTKSKPFWLVLNFFAMWYVMIDERTSHTIVVQRFLLTQQEFSRPWVKKYPAACFHAVLQAPLSLEFFYQFSILYGSLGTL